MKNKNMKTEEQAPAASQPVSTTASPLVWDPSQQTGPPRAPVGSEWQWGVLSLYDVVRHDREGGCGSRGTKTHEKEPLPTPHPPKNSIWLKVVPAVEEVSGSSWANVLTHWRRPSPSCRCLRARWDAPRRRLLLSVGICDWPPWPAPDRPLQSLSCKKSPKMKFLKNRPDWRWQVYKASYWHSLQKHRRILELGLMP